MKILIAILIQILLILLIPLSSKANGLDCLVEAVYYEARSENMISQIAVANVILQRVKDDRYPSTICEVVHQAKKWNDKIIRNKCQFSYYCDGKDEKMRDYSALVRSVNISSLVLQGVMLYKTMGATHYHAYYVRPYWTLKKRFKKLGRVGSHIFYIDKYK